MAKIKTFFLFLQSLILVSCASNLHPHQIPADQRLVIGRISHYNGKQNYGHATFLKFKTNTQEDNFQHADNSDDYNNPGYFWTTIGREENHLDLTEIHFSVEGSPMSMGKYLNHPLATATFRPGPTPLYIGDINLVTEHKLHEAKILEYQDHQREAENYLRKNFDFDHPLTKAVLHAYPEP